MESKFCQVCGKEYFKKSNVKKEQWEKSKYCSTKCSGIFARGKEKKSKKRIFIICPVCGNEFKTTPSLIKRGKKYCSKKCYSIFQKSLIGVWKDKKLSDEHVQHLKENHVGTLGKKQSEETKKKISNSMVGIPRLTMRGENHPNWKNGATPTNQKIRGSIEYKLWERIIYNKNNYECPICGEHRKKKLTAHHILNFSTYPELRFDINNGQTLCRIHHQEFHRKYGFKNNNQEQLEEFIKFYRDNKKLYES